ncbi:2-hydroxy-6-oxo-6-phenylhexa-2,4-dienoate hydrolase [Sulfolobus sp. A20]|uniref:alpha/beta fold hydrolase n=1 Tax=Sulfolobaceae TaxID=118883 RepID=UPI000845C7B1|nr:MULTISPECIES: alpha/beta hydrolase [unclassified Sulfolobus]TRM74514.1 2-hydroxy-6-oxo-6-phenylhexa-2,4-dienoate hydrolase [Sulfolobus sp. E5]TRM77935.1 2-hydroxy-6-oxo-6-phenylhexa-2,4-dienoate hydrolase [Sulfolobus sp. A20-N-F8]TRM81591.1 2-hydroxy-6-oxo-6-phenylhexa-2,4-dienoate hydrolase [Sulfolobus sp. D5]TRM83433.1 2-hydroxy-6-oxo-6-phenylhexa-2,4-dienoate hydrolase [Sulfolobus sp. A20-N-F6]TRM87950.1 2-hydroxy-6-oxo-6-phenylhexa-2,4-dienoate hydrolase [Sulfolobus sp. C3]TRM88807.1 2
MYQLKDKYVEIKGKRIHFIEEGNGDPVLLFHGARFNAYTWHETGTIKSISDNGFRAISVDFPGFGKSENVQGLKLTEFIKTFMDSLEIDKANLLGASMGGEAVLGFSVDYPNLVSSLILVGAVGVKNYENSLDKISEIPVLLVWGSNDTISPKSNYELLLKKLKNAKLKIIGRNHACYLDNPEGFNNTVVEFLKGLKNGK